jgi:hypothetical protein
MSNERTTPGPGTVWAYAYELVPPQPEDRLRAVKALLDREHVEAKSSARKWGSRFVLADQVTHILVVSDSPQQDLDVNRRLEEELRGLSTGFSVTAPMPVPDDPEVAAVDRA